MNRDKLAEGLFSFLHTRWLVFYEQSTEAFAFFMWWTAAETICACSEPKNLPIETQRS